MRELHAELPEKPEWLTLADIEKYEAEMIGVNLAKEERKNRDMDVLSQRHGAQVETDAESLPSLPGAEIRLNAATGVIDVAYSDGSMAHLRNQAAVEQFAQDVGLSATDKQRLLSLDALGKQLSGSGKALNDIPLVNSGRFVGPVVATKDGVAIQDSGRGNMVGHDMSKFDTPPKAGDKLDVRYTNGLAKVADELSKDNHSVSVAMNTR